MHSCSLTPHLPGTFSLLFVMKDSLLLVAGPGFTRIVLKMTDQLEESKNTTGQDYDQDLKQYKDDVEQPNDGSCT